MQQELDQWLARAEDPYIPEEWTKLSIPDRIKEQSLFYTMEWFGEEWEQYKAAALAPVLAGATPAQTEALRQAAEKVFDREFFGVYKALSNELTTKKRHAPDIPLSDIQKRLDAHEKEAKAAFEIEVQQIIAPVVLSDAG
jgi:hypothetical protein